MVAFFMTERRISRDPRKQRRPECVLAVILEKGHHPLKWDDVRANHCGRQVSGGEERIRAMAPAAVARTASFASFMSLLRWGIISRPPTRPSDRAAEI